MVQYNDEHGGAKVRGKLDLIKTKGLQQKDGWSCGYFALLTATDIIENGYTDGFDLIYKDPSPYSYAQIDAFRKEWAMDFWEDYQEKKDLLTSADGT